MNRRSFLRRTLAAACLGAGLALGQYREPVVETKPNRPMTKYRWRVVVDRGEWEPKPGANTQAATEIRDHVEWARGFVREAFPNA